METKEELNRNHDEKNNSSEIVKEVSLETLISKSIQIPGVKVDRDQFLRSTFSYIPESVNDILENGPINSGVSREELFKLAKKIILNQTSKSSMMSFAAGIPGGFALAATIPADVLQFFGVTLRLAQELSYLYGAQDLWNNGKIDDERVRNQLVLYCGVMFGVSGAISGVRTISSQFAKVALKKIPQKALTKTFWYPIVKQIGKSIGIKITKTTLANGVSKMLPIIGGVISGTLNFASMLPMGNRLLETLDKAAFDYTDENLDTDIKNIENLDTSDEVEKESKFSNLKNKLKDSGEGISNLFKRKNAKEKQEKKKNGDSDEFSKLEKLAVLHDSGILTDEEFESKKKELLSQI